MEEKTQSEMATRVIIYARAHRDQGCGSTLVILSWGVYGFVGIVGFRINVGDCSLCLKV